MKKLLAFLIINSWFGLAGCTSTNKTDESPDSADTSGYMQQPQDQTQVNDTVPGLNPDTMPR